MKPWLRMTFAAALTFVVSAIAPTARADDPERDGPWVNDRTEDGTFRQTAELTLYPAAAPVPALKHRLLPDSYTMVDGNSAIYYLKAAGFFEQSYSAHELFEFCRKSDKLAAEGNKAYDELPPWSWLSTAPRDLPLADVKAYLNLTGFQPPLLAEATRRAQFSLDRNIRQHDNPIGYLLPEIQVMRELARTQSLRFRVALAEHRQADALDILQQQFSLAHHLGADEFLVSNLVGMAVISIAHDDQLYWVQEPDSPNIYWALSNLPTPLVPMNNSLPIERHFFDLQVKALADVNETPRPAGYWQDFIDRILPQMRELGLQNEIRMSQEPEQQRAVFVSMIAAAYPNATRFLIEDCQMKPETVEAYPTAQTVFLATKRFYDRTADEQFKWFNLPYPQVANHPEYLRMDEELKSQSERVGWISAPVMMLLPATGAVRQAQLRVQQRLAYMQTIEAIRMYGAANSGKLPPSLVDLPYPALNDPLTGKPFAYVVQGDQATLSGEKVGGLTCRFKLRFANQP